jgi:hypothetical protein
LEGLHEDVNRVKTKKKPVIYNDDGEEKIRYIMESSMLILIDHMENEL